MAEVSVKELKLIYEDPDGVRTTALDGLSAVFPSGKLSVIAGGSGSGKTTLLRVIAGLVRGTGSVFLDGEAIDSIPVNRRGIAYVTQEFVMYPGMTVFDNIAFPLKQQRLKPDEVIRRVNEIAGKLDITLLLARKPRELSLGQQQLVALARALVRSPRVLLLDEPFAHLDPERHARLRMVIRNCAREDGVTVIYVTHSIRGAMAAADRLFVMQDGRMICCGTPQKVYGSALPEVRQLLAADNTVPPYGCPASTQPERASNGQPHTRRQAFTDILKLHFWLLVKLGGILLLFALPLLITDAVFEWREAAVTAYGAAQDNGPGVIAAVNTLRNYRLLLDIPCILLFAAGMAGALRILRRLVFYEPVFFKEDFFSGIRSNAGAALPVYLIFGMLCFLNGFVKGIFGASALTALLFGICVLQVPAALMALAALPFYRIGFFGAVKTGWQVYIRIAPLTLVMSALFASVFLPGLVPLFALRLLIRVLYVVIVHPVLWLAWMLHAAAGFDRLINAENYPSIYMKGLYKGK